MRGTGAAAAILFAFVLSIYLQTFGGVLYSIDEELYLRITASLVERGSFAVDPIEYGPDFGVARGVDGQMYPNRSPGLPLVAVPFYLLGRALAPARQSADFLARSGIDSPSGVTFSLTLANAVLVSATAALLLVVLARLGYSRSVGAAVGLLFAFGTMAWAYGAKSFFGEPLLGLCTLAAFWAALKCRQDGSPFALALAGVFIGWAMLTKVTAAALVPFAMAYLVWPGPGAPADRRQALARLLGLLCGIAPFALAWGAYNYLHFGNFLTTGYELEKGGMPLTISAPGDYLPGLAGLFLSSGKGLAIYAAPAVAGLLAAPRFCRQHPAAALYVYGVSLATVAGVALWRDWTGGWCWGPRLVLNIVPLLLIPTASLLTPVGDRPSWQQLAVGGLALVSGTVQLVGVLPNQLNWYLEVGDYTLVYFDPEYSPVVGHWSAVVQGKLDLFWNRPELFLRLSAPLVGTIRWGLVAFALAAALALWRVVRRPSSGR